MTNPDEPDVEITDANIDEWRPRIVGRTITAFDREPDSKEEWPQGENSVTLTLDDGTRLEFYGWGYDSSGVITRVVGERKDTT